MTGRNQAEGETAEAADGQEPTMEYRTLGQTEIEVSAVGMGCWAIVGDSTWGHQPRDESLDTIRAALDAGINFFDTAEAYGDGSSEEMLGAALSDRRDEAVIASKVSPDHLRAEDLRESCERSLSRLGTDHIDLYQVHWPNWDIPMEEALGTMETLQEEGKIRAIGVSNFGKKDLQQALSLASVETDQLAYNLLFRAIEEEIQSECVENDVGILCYCPLAQGLLTGKFTAPGQVPEGRARTRHFSKNRPRARHSEEGAERDTFQALEKIKRICQEIDVSMAQASLSWLLGRAGVTSVLAGARTPEQVESNAQASELELPREVTEQLTEASEHLKEKLGPNPDMWFTDSRIR